MSSPATRDADLRVGILQRKRADEGSTGSHPLFDSLAPAFDSVGVRAERVAFAEEAIGVAREQLLQLGAVLVWVDPISDGLTRVKLDALLREVSACGVWVAAHPDVIAVLGTKEVLVRTRTLGWGTDTRLYASAAQLRDEFPRVLASTGPRVLKQNRGNGGIGVFRVDLVDGNCAPGPRTMVRVQHARRGSPREDMPLEELLRRCEAYFAGGGRVVDQPFAARHAEGMVRAYMVHDRVAGFGQQRVTALMDPAPGELAPPLPPPREYCGPATPAFTALGAKLESEWIPQAQALLGLEREALPALWDADFLLGPKSASGADTYVLCEINASSVYPFPREAVEPLVRSVAARLRAREITV